MFRVSSTSMRESWLRTMQTVQSDLARTQTQIATGKRFNSPAEDPVAATRTLRLDNSLQQNQQFTRNIGLAESRLSLEENALESVGNIVQRLRELAVQANNATQSPETRAATAREARQQLDALIQVANSQDGNGDYLFAGFQSSTRPFSQTATGVTYNGDQGAREVQISADRRIADSNNGYDVFMNIRNGNGTFAVTPGAGNQGNGIVGVSSVNGAYAGGAYTVTFTAPDAYTVSDSGGNPVTSGTFAAGQSISFAGIEFTVNGTPAATDTFSVAPSARQSVFQTAQNLVNALESGALTPASLATMHSAIGRTLQEFDQAIGTVLGVRTDVGARLNALDSQAEVNADLELNLKELVSELRDLDYADALTRLQQQMATMQAAQASYAKTQGLSLFNYF